MVDNPNTGAVSKQPTTTISESDPRMETDVTTLPLRPTPSQADLPLRPRTKKKIEDILFLKPKPKTKHPIPEAGMPGKRPVPGGKAMQRLREAGMIILADGTLEKPREPLPVDGAEEVLGFLEPKEEEEDRSGCVNVFQKGKSRQAVKEARSGTMDEHREPWPVDGTEEMLEFLEPEEEVEDRACCMKVFQKGKYHQAVKEVLSGALDEALSPSEHLSEYSNLTPTIPPALSQASVIDFATNEKSENDPPRI